MKVRPCSIAFILMLFAGCLPGKKTDRLIGDWHFKFRIGSQALPFNAQIVEKEGKLHFVALNGDERIRADVFEIDQDSIFVRLPIFNTALIGRLNDTIIEGVFFDYSRKGDYQIPFVATRGNKSRFDGNRPALVEVSGKWRVEFSPGSDNAYMAIGVFEQSGNKATGTFLTSTGDYRYLDGNVVGDSLFLSCFDGSHVFLFKAKVEEDKIVGNFWSGKHWQENWVGERDEQAELPNPNKLTFLKPNYDQLEFTFENLRGEIVSLSDEKYIDKVVIVQIMGSWCPNCMDETSYLVQLHEKFHLQGLEVISLAFEKSDNKQTNIRSLNRLKEHFNISYEILLAGKSNKNEAAEKLPMLNHIISFPTTIFIDRQGDVRRIHTGFTGPGTGEYYQEFVEETDRFVTQLLIE